MTLDHQGQTLLGLLQDRHGSDAYQDVADVSAQDAEGRLRLVVDAACRVRDVRVLDLDRLRTPCALAAALTGAFTAADTDRALASLQRSGALAAWAAAGEAMRTRPMLTSYDDFRAAGRLGRPAEPPPCRGRSTNGYLELTVAGDGTPRDLRVDEDWLAGTTTEHLRRALIEACTATHLQEI